MPLLGEMEVYVFARDKKNRTARRCDAAASRKNEKENWRNYEDTRMGSISRRQVCRCDITRAKSGKNQKVIHFGSLCRYGSVLLSHTEFLSREADRRSLKASRRNRDTHVGRATLGVLSLVLPPNKLRREAFFPLGLQSE